MRLAVLACGFALVLTACGGGSVSPPSSATNQSQNVSHKKVYQSGGVSLTLTPNYNANFGPVPAFYPTPGHTPLPAPGPAASLDGGDIDFGTVSPGLEYYYQYGMQVAVSASSAYVVVAALSGDFGPGFPASALTWLPANTTHQAYLNNFPFGSEANPLPIFSASTTTTESFDYMLYVPIGAQPGAVTTQIEYSVIP